MNKRMFLALAVICIVIVSLLALSWRTSKPRPVPSVSPASSVMSSPSAQKSPEASVVYMCKGGRKIEAVFYKGEPLISVVPGQPPVPNGEVDVKLDDGRTWKLTQTISADGSRYANSDESFVFWSKGDGALVLENSQEKTYTGCVVTHQP